MKSFFHSEVGKKEIIALYQQKLDDLQIQYEEADIMTRFGKTRIIKTGDPTHPPLLLIHGSNGCAPVALEAYPNLSQHFEVYAIDVLAQPNKSEGLRLSMKDNTYGQWIEELIEAMDLEQVTLLGFSFGGLIILKTLIHSEKKIKEAFLASPAYIVNGNPLKALLRMFIPIKRYMKTKDMKYVRQVIAQLFTDQDPFAIQYLSKVFQHFEMDFTPVPVISRQEAQLIKTPITLFAGGEDLIFPGPKMIKRAKKIFPSLKEVVFFKESKHVQNRPLNEQVERVVITHAAKPLQA